MSVVSKSFPYGPHSITIETGELARQADGAVKVSMGETVVLVTAVARQTATPGRDFLPLTVNYIEKTYRAAVSDDAAFVVFAYRIYSLRYRP